MVSRITYPRIALAAALVCTFLFAGVTPAAHAGSAPGWIVRCPLSHRMMDDPIVAPGQPGAAHIHDFFGNTTTDAFSTPSSLRGGTTTCVDHLDLSGYWTPTVYKDGVKVEPTGMLAYYLSQVPPSKVKPFPARLEMVAGNSHATGPQSDDITYWNCHSGPDPHSPTPYDCGSSTLDVHVDFPQCWDGVHLDSADHASHMAYPVRSGGVFSCPASHPVAVPRLVIRVSYPFHNGNGVTLSSGAAYTTHADFMNAWDRAELSRLVQNCIHANVACGIVKR